MDYWIGHLALILGHNHPVVTEALREQLEHGVHWGTATPGEVDLAELVVDAVPCAEEVRFCNTGAEATMYAARLARGYTGRSVILKAEGGWHGFSSDLLVGVNGPFEGSESLGLPTPSELGVKTFPFNDVETTVEAIRQEGDLAALIVEPVLGAGGAIPADRDFLLALREETERVGALLIFDEVITGFRLGLGGGQEYYGVTPDLVTLGKILGGGLPVGCVAGRGEVMELADPRRGAGKRVSIGGGTFSANPLTMSAGLSTLRYLKQHPSVYEKLGAMGKEIRERATAPFQDRGMPALCTGVESMFQVHFPRKEGVDLRSARDVYELTDSSLREESFKLGLLTHGVYTVHGGGGLSTAHEREDLERFFQATDRVAEVMARERP